MLNRVSRKGAKFCSQTIRQAESSTRKVIKHDSTKKLAKFAKTKFINHIGMVQNMLLKKKSDNKDSTTQQFTKYRHEDLHHVSFLISV